MNRTVLAVITAAFALSACGGSGSLSSPAKAWCLDNPAVVLDAAGDLGLLGYVEAYYEVRGDGLGDDGDPVFTTRNVELSEDMKKRNVAEPEEFFNDLFATYLTHPDGEQACAAAFAEEG